MLLSKFRFEEIEKQACNRGYHETILVVRLFEQLILQIIHKK